MKNLLNGSYLLLNGVYVPEHGPPKPYKKPRVCECGNPSNFVIDTDPGHCGDCDGIIIVDD